MPSPNNPGFIPPPGGRTPLPNNPFPPSPGGRTPLPNNPFPPSPGGRQVLPSPMLGPPGSPGSAPPPPPMPPPNLLQQLAASISQGASGIMNAPTGMPYDPFGAQPDLSSPSKMLQQLSTSVQGLPQQPWVKKQMEAARVRSGPGVEGLSPADIARIVGESEQQRGQMPRR